MNDDLIPISQLMTATLGSGPLAGRGIDLIQKARGVDSDLDSGLRLDLPANAFR